MTQMLDCATAPSLSKCMEAAKSINAGGWNAYIGGPRSAGSGWTPELVRELLANGLKVCLCYVGQQGGSTLNSVQGAKDGAAAVSLVQTTYGFGRGTPVVLDIEESTFENNPNAALDYAVAWIQTVRNAGLKPGIYSGPKALEALAARDSTAWSDFVWVASWQSTKYTSSVDPHHIPGFPDGLWRYPGQRIWQYAGSFGGQQCVVDGLSVDISVADDGCLVSRPNAPVLTAPQNGQPYYQHDGQQQHVTFSWNTVPGATGYRLYISQQINGSWTKLLDTWPRLTSTTYSLNLGFGNYVWEVAADIGPAESAWSAQFEFTVSEQP